jgi:hypothetical protein
MRLYCLVLAFFIYLFCLLWRLLGIGLFGRHSVGLLSLDEVHDFNDL